MNCFSPFKGKPKSQNAKSSLEELMEGKGHNLRVFTYSELKTATDNFNSSLKVGEGGFGSVYKATIRHPNGKEGVPTAVAIKRFTGERVISSTFFFLVSYLVQNSWIILIYALIVFLIFVCSNLNCIASYYLLLLGVGIADTTR